MTRAYYRKYGLRRLTPKEIKERNAYYAARAAKRKK